MRNEVSQMVHGSNTWALVIEGLFRWLVPKDSGQLQGSGNEVWEEGC